MYVTGDSFAFGDEMGVEQDYTKQTDYQKEHCYSYLMSKKLNVETYVNTALRGGSNERMYRVMLKDVSNLLVLYKPEEIFVTMGFSHAARREFCWNDEGDYYIHIPSAKPDSFTPFSKLWDILNKSFNYDVGIYNHDAMIKMAIMNFLRVHKIPHLLTTSIIVTGDRLREAEHVQKNILEQMKSKRFMDMPSFMEFNHGKHPVAPGLHPLEEGHAAWAEELLGYIQQHDILDNSDL